MSCEFSDRRTGAARGTSYPDVAEMVAGYAVPSALAAFGLGLGVGLALAGLMESSEPVRQQRITERLGRQLVDTLASMLPDSLSARR